ncbi:phosphoglycerate mutase-like protein [Xylona heveae TC161]|uniref:3-phytase n=1 Tax=Xylona heveae (strain CBS 132557 / TC161) TaxID=1328760 RepID=A0A165K4B9_XYLHT|nr:phosphoglycerate mutase-like protein [Xylona heveae TC161]KZF26967.1 phosphoglycerate mutase-like protein [Xylona heveae TC161]
MRTVILIAFAALADAAAVRRNEETPAASSTINPYFQTTPELFAGPTATGEAPFLAQTNSLPPTGVSYIPPYPLETQIPIADNPQDENIFQSMGLLSPYYSTPEGHGVDEYPLPPGSNISQLHMLHRHGARYPGASSGVTKFGQKMMKLKGTFKATGALSFLNDWTYKLGKEILVPVGRQQLFDSGIAHYYQYGHLYNTSTNIVVRSTTQDRMRNSAEYFLAGFFGQDWTRNASLELLVEANGFNNTMTGWDNCPMSDLGPSLGGFNASDAWEAVYLQNATARLAALIEGYNWTLSDTYNAQSLCPYETVGLGYSKFCDLFTLEEWQAFEYNDALNLAGNYGFQSPTGRATAVGYVGELLGRLDHHLLTETYGQANITLDNNTATFPLNQSLYLDFSHDTNMFSILVAMGFKQFAPFLPEDRLVLKRDFIVSHLVPFAGRFDIEIIKTPQPVPEDRSTDYIGGPPTTYIHFIVNQRTLSLGRSFPECGLRADGWCELGTFIDIQKGSLKEADFDFACFGNYPSLPYGSIKNGAPLRS